MGSSPIIRFFFFFLHAAGDSALVRVAEVLRKDGEAFRYGGDEFVLVLPAVGHAEAEAVAESLQARVRRGDDGEHPLTVTVGVATYPEDELDRTEIVAFADQVLYGRKGGRPAFAPVS